MYQTRQPVLVCQSNGLSEMLLLKSINLLAFLVFLSIMLSAIYQGPLEKLMENRTVIKEGTIDLWGKSVQTVVT